MNCPDVTHLREIAEEPSLAKPELRAHVDECSRCRRLVELASAEEASLRAALPLAPPKGSLEATLAAIAAAEGPRPASKKRRRPKAKTTGYALPAFWILALTLLAVGSLKVLRGPERVDAPPVEVPQPDAPPTDAPPLDTPPADTPPADTPPADAPPADTPPADPLPDDDAEPPVDTTPTLPEPTEGPIVVDAPKTPKAPDTPGQPETRIKALARLESGSLRAAGQELEHGATVPTGVVHKVGSSAAVLSGHGTARLWLAPRSLVSVHDQAGVTVFRLAQGAVYLRTEGDRPYALATPAGHASPLGTAFLVAHANRKTRIMTYDGSVRFTAPRADSILVRAGFAAAIREGKAPTLAQPSTSRLPRWLPKTARPKTPPRFSLIQALSFEKGTDGFTRGDAIRGGAGGSRGCLRAVRRDDTYAVYVELERESGVMTLDPNLWIEVRCRVDRRAKVVIQVWDVDAGENLAHFVTLDPGQWTTLSAPLRAFTDASGNPRRAPVTAGNRGTCFNVFAGREGQALELLVDDVRLFAEH
jgi:hypothetical protein